MRPWTAIRPCPRDRCAGRSTPRTSSRSSAEYEAATEDGAKGAILRREGLYTSHISEWRRARDAGALAGLAAKPSRGARPPSNASWPASGACREGRGGTGQGPPGDRHPGKSIGALGTAAGRERRGPEAAAVIDAAFETLEPLVGTSGACHAVGRPRASHYRRQRGPRSGPPKPRPTPANALAADERAAVLEVLHSDRFVDQAPAQVWATLLDEGTYLGSESTMYRLLRADGEVRERRRQATHPPRTVPELVAAEPNRVWSYDATALRGPARGDLVRPLHDARHLQPLQPRLDGRGAGPGRPGRAGLDRGHGRGIRTHPRRQAEHPRRSRLGDDLQGRRGPARRPEHRAHPLPAPREQR